MGYIDGCKGRGRHWLVALFSRLAVWSEPRHSSLNTVYNIPFQNYSIQQLWLNQEKNKPTWLLHTNNFCKQLRILNPLGNTNSNFLSSCTQNVYCYAFMYTDDTDRIYHSFPSNLVNTFAIVLDQNGKKFTNILNRFYQFFYRFLILWP